jgi:hypothetical protein
MKPYDGGGWRGVTHIKDRDKDLFKAYDESAQQTMHIQQGITRLRSLLPLFGLRSAGVADAL